METKIAPASPIGLPRLPVIKDFSKEMDQVTNLIGQAEVCMRKAAYIEAVSVGELAWAKDEHNYWRIMYRSIAPGLPPVTSMIPLIQTPFQTRVEMVHHVPELMLKAQAAMEQMIRNEKEKS